MGSLSVRGHSASFFIFLMLFVAFRTRRYPAPKSRIRIPRRFPQRYYRRRRRLPCRTGKAMLFFASLLWRYGRQQGVRSQKPDFPLDRKSSHRPLRRRIGNIGDTELSGDEEKRQHERDKKNLYHGFHELDWSGKTRSITSGPVA